MRVLRREVPLVIGSLLCAALVAGCGSTVSGASGQLAGSTDASGLGLSLGDTPSPTTQAGSDQPSNVLPSQSSASASTAEADSPTSSSDGPISIGAPAPKKVVLGLLAYDVASLFASVGGSFSSDAQASNRALVNAVNIHGGIDGRKIDPVYYTINGTATDYSSQQQAACASFTQDHHVQAVIGGGGDSTLYGCLLKAHVPMLSTGGIEALDETAWKELPNFFAPDLLSIDRQARAVMNQSVEAGWLTSKNTLGVVLAGCPWSSRAYASAVLPVVQRLGIKVQTDAMGCPPDGAGSVGSTSTAMQGAALKFRSLGVDRVMMLAANLDPTSFLFFTKNADSQGYYPQYLLGSSGGANVFATEGLITARQLSNTHVVGFAPFLDVGNPTRSKQFTSCVKLAESGGGSSAPSAQPGYATTCDAFSVLQAAFKISGGVGGLAALQPAIEKLGSSFVGAGTIQGKVTFGRDRHDGARLAQTSAYKGSCKCFEYIRAAEPA